MRVRVDNGKYTFIVFANEPSEIKIERGGQPWAFITPGVKAVHSMMCELDAARVVLSAVRALVADLGDAAPKVLRDALARHASLVDDREIPSDWTT